jgi:hypothetical protein
MLYSYLANVAQYTSIVEKIIKKIMAIRCAIMNFAIYLHVASSQNLSMIYLSYFGKLILYLTREYIFLTTGSNKIVAIKRK